MVKRIISLFVLIAVLFAMVSCKKRPELEFSESGDSYIYINQDYGKHERHYLDIVIPKEPTSEQGIILYIHGGGWIGGDKEAYTDRLKHDASLGYVAAAINYRYADAKRVTWDDIMDDIDAALAKIKDICAGYGYNLTKVIIGGGSAGAHLSLMYAYTRVDTAPVKPVVAVSYAGPTDLTDLNFYATQYREDIEKMIYSISGAKVTKKPVSECEDLLLNASPISYVNSNTVPTLLCHGMKDDVVPYSNATTLFDLLKKNGVKVELITFPNSGHGLEADSDKSSYADETFYKYVDEYLK